MADFYLPPLASPGAEERCPGLRHGIDIHEAKKRRYFRTPTRERRYHVPCAGTTPATGSGPRHSAHTRHRPDRTPSGFSERAAVRPPRNPEGRYRLRGTQVGSNWLTAPRLGVRPARLGGNFAGRRGDAPIEVPRRGTMKSREGVYTLHLRPFLAPPLRIPEGNGPPAPPFS